MTSFAPDVSTLFIEYDVLAKEYPGWGLGELKTMARRERKYFMTLIKWRRDNSART